jgi:hypothetical protein
MYPYPVPCFKLKERRRRYHPSGPLTYCCHCHRDNRNPAYTSNHDSIALNMGKIKKFKEIGLDTFSYFLQRVGIADQYRDDVMTAAMAAGNAVLTKWEQVFVEFDVPPHLIEKVRTHVSGLRLGSEL